MKPKEPAENRIYFGKCVEVLGVPDDETVRLLVWTPHGAEPGKEVVVGWDAVGRFDPEHMWLDYSTNALSRTMGAIGVVYMCAEFLVKNQISLRGPKIPKDLAL